jgi:acetylornithine/succinyldiaminopimelate/putrescine aminotransferase
VIGFEHSMHGKSMATAHLGWDNHDDVRIPEFHRLPFVSSCSEDAILESLAGRLRHHPISAVFVEPIQASGGGHMASPRWYGEVARLCREHDALLVFDEILTGFHRTGPPFFFSTLGVVPDVVLLGKALGNGFPVSGVVVHRRHAIVKAMLPGSTYAGNPLAAAAVLATLQHMQDADLPSRVARIDAAIRAGLGHLGPIGVALRGRGALWVLELPPGLDVEQAAISIYRAGVCVGFAGRYLRILPAATIEPDHLARACAVIAEQLERISRGRTVGP